MKYFYLSISILISGKSFAEGNKWTIFPSDSIEQAQCQQGYPKLILWSQFDGNTKEWKTVASTHVCDFIDWQLKIEKCGFWKAEAPERRFCETVG